MSEYQVELDSYAGPLDLLLYLIKEAEVDVYDIPISTITDRYLEHLEEIQRVDLNRAGEFLVVASQLMEIKAKMLIPRETIDMDDVEDPRASLVQELLEYRRFKEASRELGERLEEQQQRYGRPKVKLDAAPEEPEEPEEEIEDLDIFDLVTAFSRIQKEIYDVGEPSIIYDDVPVRVHMEQILERLRDRRAVSFEELVLAKKDRRGMLGVFLALLELVKIRRIRARQPEHGGEILITLREEIPADAPISFDQYEVTAEATAAPVEDGVPEEMADGSADETAEETADGATVDAVDGTVDETAEEAADEPAGHVADETADETADEDPADLPTDAADDAPEARTPPPATTEDLPPHAAPTPSPEPPGPFPTDMP